MARGWSGELKQLFYKDGTTAAAGATGTEVAATRANQDLGHFRDLPIARFRFVLMPHQQAAFNIFQPQLVHMFETLLATPRPWLYVHALLPGGTDNLGDPEYALPGLGEGGAAGPEATRGAGPGGHGQAAARVRIVLTCQALGRAVVLRGTQALPCRAAPPDAEQPARPRAPPWRASKPVRRGPARRGGRRQGKEQVRRRRGGGRGGGGAAAAVGGRGGGAGAGAACHLERRWRRGSGRLRVRRADPGRRRAHAVRQLSVALWLALPWCRHQHGAASCVRRRWHVGAALSGRMQRRRRALRAGRARRLAQATEAEAEAEGGGGGGDGGGASETQVWLSSTRCSAADRTDAAHAAPRNDAACAQLLAPAAPARRGVARKFRFKRKRWPAREHRG